MTIVSLFALSKESSVPFLKENFCSTSRTNVAFVFSGFLFFMLTIIMIFVLWSIGKRKFFKLIYIDVFTRLKKQSTTIWRHNLGGVGAKNTTTMHILAIVSTYLPPRPPSADASAKTKC